MNKILTDLHQTSWQIENNNEDNQELYKFTFEFKNGSLSTKSKNHLLVFNTKNTLYLNFPIGNLHRIEAPFTNYETLNEEQHKQLQVELDKEFATNFKILSEKEFQNRQIDKEDRYVQIMSTLEIITDTAFRVDIFNKNYQDNLLEGRFMESCIYELLSLEKLQCTCCTLSYNIDTKSFDMKQDTMLYTKQV